MRKNYDTVYERDGINYFWSIKNSNEVLNKYKSTIFKVSSLSTYDFSTMYTMLYHHLIKDTLTDFINQTFIRENTKYLTCNEQCVFSLLMYTRITIYGLVKKSFIRFGTKFYRQTIGMPLGTNCAPLVVDLFIFCYERECMKSLSRENRLTLLRLSIPLQDILMIY